MPAPLPSIITNQIVDGLAAGNTHADVADMLGVCRETVTRKAKLLKGMIEQRALDYFETMVPRATKINSQCVQAAENLYDTCKPSELSGHAPILNQAHKISDRVLQSVGIAPSLAPSVVVQNFVQVNGNVAINPQVSALFSPSAMSNLGAIDADFSEIGEAASDE